MYNVDTQNPINSGTIENTAAGNTATATNTEKPEWVRLPQPGQKCKYTGLSRSTLNELCVDGPINDHNAKVKSTLLKKRGAMRGIRLISYDSLMAFLNSANEEGVIVS
jgi:hypothetical protein